MKYYSFFFLIWTITFPIALFIYQFAFSSFYLGATIFDNSNSLATSGRTYRSFSKPIFSYLGLTAIVLSLLIIINQSSRYSNHTGRQSVVNPVNQLINHLRLTHEIAPGQTTRHVRGPNYILDSERTDYNLTPTEYQIRYSLAHWYKQAV